MSNQRGAGRRRPRRRTRVPSQRQLRAAELIRHVLAEVLTLEEIHHKELESVTITVTEVTISSDLRRADCFIMPLGGRNTDGILVALREVAPWISGQVARRVRLKFAPQLTFRIDDTFDQAENIRRLLRRPDVAPDLVDPKG